MSSQPLLLPQVAVDDAELRAALQSVAVPGYTGSLYVEIGLREEVEDGQHRYYVVMAVSRRESKRAEAQSPSVVRQILPDVERRKPVERVLSVVRPRLFVRTVLQGVEIHFKDGVVQPNITIRE